LAGLDSNPPLKREKAYRVSGGGAPK